MGAQWKPFGSVFTRELVRHTQAQYGGPLVLRHVYLSRNERMV
jgi:hypothetical protein